MNWLSVQTCSGRDKYLGATIANIDRAGGAKFVGRKVIFVGGPTDPIDGRFPGWEVESISDEVRKRVLMPAGRVFHVHASIAALRLPEQCSEVSLTFGRSLSSASARIPSSWTIVWERATVCRDFGPQTAPPIVGNRTHMCRYGSNPADSLADHMQETELPHGCVSRPTRL